jgi:hypothetical protein
MVKRALNARAFFQVEIRSSKIPNFGHPSYNQLQIISNKMWYVPYFSICPPDNEIMRLLYPPPYVRSFFVHPILSIRIIAYSKQLKITPHRFYCQMY